MSLHRTQHTHTHAFEYFFFLSIIITIYIWIEHFCVHLKPTKKKKILVQLWTLPLVIGYYYRLIDDYYYRCPDTLCPLYSTFSFNNYFIFNLKINFSKMVDIGGYVIVLVERDDKIKLFGKFFFFFLYSLSTKKWN